MNQKQVKFIPEDGVGSRSYYIQITHWFNIQDQSDPMLQEHVLGQS